MSQLDVDGVAEAAIAELEAVVLRLGLELEEVEYQLRGGTDTDGAVSGLDGLTLSEVANVLHSRAAHAELLEAAIKAHRGRKRAPLTTDCIDSSDELLWSLLDQD